MGHAPQRPLPPDPVLIAMNRPYAPFEKRLGDAPATVMPTADRPSDEGITLGTVIGAALVYGALDSVWGEDS